MRWLCSGFVCFTLIALPGAASAGPIAFRLSGSLDVDAGHDDVAASLAFAVPPGELAFDPAAGPTTVPLLHIDPPVLPSDPPNVPDQGGGTYYDSAYLRATVRVTDVASGEQAEVTINGRAHAEWAYGGANQWFGNAYVWFGNWVQTLTLGGQPYTLWVPMWYTTPEPELHVWVGPDAPVTATPEPGTLALAGLGLVLTAARRWRKH